MEDVKQYIYILTNPSFKEYVKIGYSKNVEKRVKKLSKSSAIPYSFHVYATYETPKKDADKYIHSLIDFLNEDLRTKEEDRLHNKIREREFYRLDPEDAYKILEIIAEVSGTTDKLKKVDERSKDEILEEKLAEKGRELCANRYRFKEIIFMSNGIQYKGTFNDDGNLKLIDLTNNIDVVTPMKPIIRQALKELNIEFDSGYTTHQLYRLLSKYWYEKSQEIE